jgi:ubiquinone/menaquinone biosynthesis C-methylase UbiE
MYVSPANANSGRPATIPTAFLRFFFKHLYTTIAWTYDAVAWIVSLGQWSDWQNAGLQAMPEGSILELGHGPGHLLVAAGCTGRIAYGVDSSAQMSRLAARRVLQEGFDIRLARARAQELPFASAVFDGIISTFPSEYIMDPASLAEASRVMKPGAKLVLVLVGISTGRTWLERFAAWVFEVTGQGRPPGPIPDGLFSGSGMVVRAEWVALARSSVLRVELLKPTDRTSLPE